jgi:uncharacterized protein YjbI with pentapeptide repeats
LYEKRGRGARPPTGQAPAGNRVESILSHIRSGEQLDAAVISAADLREALTSSVSDPDPEGLSISGAAVHGRLELRHLTLAYPLRFEHCSFADGIDLSGGTLTQLRFEHVELAGAEAALDLNGATLRGDLLLRKVSVRGRVELMRSDIKGRLEIDATIDAKRAKGPALNIDGAEIRGDILLVGSFEGVGTQGAVRLAAARVGGKLAIESETRFFNPSGPALSAGGLHVAREAELICDAVGAGTEGAITFQGAEIGGSFDIFGGATNRSGGPALDASDVHVVRDFQLKADFEGSGKQGAVILAGAKLDQSADFRYSTIISRDSFAVVADRMQVGGDLHVANALTEISGLQQAGVVRLSDVRVAGQLKFAPDSAHNKFPGAPVWIVEGLTYQGYPQIGDKAVSLTKRWLTLLARNPTYPASAYQHFAAVARAAGHDSDVREILIAQRRDQVRRGGLSGRERWWAKFTWVTLGYGYQPWRALLFLVGVIATSVLLSLVLGTFGALTVKSVASTGASTGASSQIVRPCTRIEQVGVALDKSIPLVKNGASDSCKPSSTPVGNVWTVASWVLQLLGWVFATLFVVGFTGAVRKT